MVLVLFNELEEPCIAESIKLAGSKMFHLHYADSNRMYPGAVILISNQLFKLHRISVIPDIFQGNIGLI